MHAFSIRNSRARIENCYSKYYCLICFSKLNLSSKFHAEVATHLPHIKLRTLLYILYTLNIIL